MATDGVHNPVPHSAPLYTSSLKKRRVPAPWRPGLGRRSVAPHLRARAGPNIVFGGKSQDCGARAGAEDLARGAGHAQQLAPAQAVDVEHHRHLWHVAARVDVGPRPAVDRRASRARSLWCWSTEADKHATLRREVEGQTKAMHIKERRSQSSAGERAPIVLEEGRLLKPEMQIPRMSHT